MNSKIIDNSQLHNADDKISSRELQFKWFPTSGTRVPGGT